MIIVVRSPLPERPPYWFSFGFPNIMLRLNQSENWKPEQVFLRKFQSISLRGREKSFRSSTDFSKLAMEVIIEEKMSATRKCLVILEGDMS